MFKKAPIAFFAYKRPIHARKALESLSNCEGAGESELFIFCDGARKEKDLNDVMEVRRIAKSRGWCGVDNIIERDKNLGLANSIISGVTELCDKYGRVIVVEDDLLVSRYFLDYMNAALDMYENNERVMQISGHMFPVELSSATDAVFLPHSTSWGWATWRRAWMNFDKDMKGYEILKKDAGLRRKFDLDGAYPYFKMLKLQHDGKIDSWAIRWHLSVFMLGGLTLFPVKTLVENIGFDKSGTHGNSSEKHLSGSLKNVKVQTFPSEIEVSRIAFEKCKKFLEEKKATFFQDVIRSLNGLISKYKSII